MNPFGMKEEADVEAEGERMERGTFFFKLNTTSPEVSFTK